MASEDNEGKILLPHHVQQPLCTTRLPYRQGRKLTAVKTYTVNHESNHLLIFGVPSLSLRQELKAHFLKFGKLLQFNITDKYPTEAFTETYHAAYEKNQSARMAKRIMDTKNFYGGSLHVCYAPELETIEDTRHKLLQRQKDVMFRLRNLEKEKLSAPLVEPAEKEAMVEKESKKINMGEINTISIGKQIRDVVNNVKRKKINENRTVKKHKLAFIEVSKETHNEGKADDKISNNKTEEIKHNEDLEVVDCTSVDKETVTNINEMLNYDKFGNEIVRNVPVKNVNKIVFNIVNKKL